MVHIPLVRCHKYIRTIFFNKDISTLNHKVKDIFFSYKL